MWQRQSPAGHPLIKYVTAVFLVAAVTLLLWILRDALTLANFSLLYTLATLVTAIWLGTGPSLLAAGTSFVCFNFFLIRPFYTLKVEDPRELLDLFIFLLVAVIAGQLAAYARKQADAARLNAAEQNFLYSLSSSFNQLTDREGIYAELQRVVRESLGARDVSVLPQMREAATTEDATTSYLLLQAGEHIYGALQATFAAPPSPSQSRLLMACAVQAAMALQRIDLTEHAQRSHTLEEADKLKTALLHAVSHDLRTPITIIKTSASNLYTLHDRLPEEKQLEMIRAIDNEVDHLDRLVGNLLDMSRLKAGAMVINKDWNALSEIAGDVAARAWQLSRQERIKLIFPEEMPLVRCDYGLMLQALGNIVDNVLRYEPAGSQVEIRGSYSASEVQIAIVNHGETISPEEKELIMEPFYHGRDGHIGLGLAISKGIVEAHQGKIWVEDTPGGGATFVVSLPREEPGEQPNVDPGRR
ncbi:MAG: DUF4118 domain-containing protein [Chloroflexi bacterium]|nr:DUF4118 domain-containing protein [Chloroflexota bacterium]MCI0575277.1 DUF4118 domain-containing protein [Chloroflexota bacterium]MCI0645723.1 DUF4118 domain-containing protein [Chloroflexota bacterium]MCI0730128.1 DUF4118 domain-containing protein [Chloroflexota bacterium]